MTHEDLVLIYSMIREAQKSRTLVICSMQKQRLRVLHEGYQKSESETDFPTELQKTYMKGRCFPTQKQSSD